MNEKAAVFWILVTAIAVCCVPLIAALVQWLKMRRLQRQVEEREQARKDQEMYLKYQAHFYAKADHMSQLFTPLPKPISTKDISASRPPDHVKLLIVGQGVAPLTFERNSDYDPGFVPGLVETIIESASSSSSDSSPADSFTPGGGDSGGAGASDS